MRALVLFIAFACTARAADLAPPRASRQAVVVESRDWRDDSGTLQRFERRTSAARWQRVGEPVPVKLGRAGMAWGLGLHGSGTGDEPRKIEGDCKAPAGVFRITGAFGFDAPNASVKLPYTRIHPGIEAVDDPRSRFYNRIVDRTTVGPVDWSSSEKMSRVGKRYRLGLVVAHNPQCRPGAGSCIFLHIWDGTGRGTSGCTAMPPAAVSTLHRWLDPAAHPVLVQLPASIMPGEFPRIEQRDR